MEELGFAESLKLLSLPRLIDFTIMLHGQNRNLHIRAMLGPAQGFFELGMFDDATKTLDHLALEDQAHPFVILLRIDILLGLHRFEDAVILGEASCERWHIVEGFSVKTAFGHIELGNYEQALVILYAAPESLHQRAAYWFDLARCESRLGEIERAKKSIARCVERDKEFKQRVLEAPDLKAVWESL